MDCRQSGLPESSAKSYALADDPLTDLISDQLVSPIDYSNICFDVGNAQFFPEFATSMDLPSDHQSYEPYTTNCDMKMENEFDSTDLPNNTTQLDWNPRAVLSNLASLEQRIHKVQDVVRSIIGKQDQMCIRQDELAAQQQSVTADVTSIVTQLISTAGSLLPSVRNTVISQDRSVGQLENIISSSIDPSVNGNLGGNELFLVDRIKTSEHGEASTVLNCTAPEAEFIPIEEHDVKESDDGGECENLPPGSYEVLQLEKEEILAPHTHFCLICGKGFKRDANLRMHMRGHGDEYKTPAALAKPVKDSSSGSTLIKRYSCPIAGCKRNKDHRKFQPLKTLMCVKNHYKRTHCDKSYTCSRCNNKKYSILADLKTHEKHCGRDKWLCSCGTTFSRKDKLFGHVALFQGHTPTLPMDDIKGSGTPSLVQKSERIHGIGGAGFSFGGNSSDADFLDVKAFNEDSSFFRSATFDPCKFGGFHEFP